MWRSASRGSNGRRPPSAKSAWGINSLTQHERNEVALFRRGAFSAEHVVAVSSKPFLRFRLIAVTIWIRRGRHRLNVLAGAGLPGLSWVCRMTGRAGRRVGLACREIGPEEMLASLSRKSAEAGIGGFGLACIEIENGRFASGGGRKRAGENDDRNQGTTGRLH